MIMKKYLLFLLAFLPMVLFTACSSDDENESKQELSYMQVKFHFTPYNTSGYIDSKKIYTKEIYLFRLDNKQIKEPIIPYSTQTSYGQMCVIDDVNGNYVYSDYSGDYAQLKDDRGDYTFDCMATAIYNYNFNQKTSLQKGEHLLVIKANGTFVCKNLSISPHGDNAVYDFNLVQTGKDGINDKVVWF